MTFRIVHFHNGPVVHFGGSVQVGPVKYDRRFEGTGLYAINDRGESLALAFDAGDMEPLRPRWVVIGE